ncbi:MAG: hypothetical protein KJ601_02685, partial [Nanoarchaeota archaeon]|nr:hypothetical protein [Nanoarchaeota archaeon]
MLKDSLIKAIVSFILILGLAFSVTGATGYFGQEPYAISQAKNSVVSQEQLDLRALEGEFSNDARFKDLYDYAGELGYTYPSSMMKSNYQDGSQVINVVIYSTDSTKYLLLTKQIKDGLESSILFKVETDEVALFDRDGGVRVNEDGISGYSTHQSCSTSLCTGACIVYYGWGTNELAGWLRDIADNMAGACSGCSQNARMCSAICAAGASVCTTVVACVPAIAPCVGCVGITCGECIANAGLNIWDLLVKINNCRKDCSDDPSKYNKYPGWHCDPKKKESKWQCNGDILQKVECNNCDWAVVYERDCASSGKTCGLAYSSSMKVIEYQCKDNCKTDAECDDNNDCTTEYCEQYLGKCQYKGKTCPKPSDRCSISYCANGQGCVTKPDPGCDHPDDAVAATNLGGVVSAVVVEEEPVEDALIKTAVLFEGFPQSTKDLLDSLDKNYTFVNVDIKLEDLLEYELFIIPAGGLTGLEGSLSFKNKIADYVDLGGNLLVFSQQHGSEYSVLPLNVEGFGWLEDQSCQFASVYLETYHPMLSSIERNKPNVNVDGYFTDWPENSTILLRRVKNTMPVLIKYPYGKGTVMAYTAYSDWVYGRGASKEEVIFIRDFINWAENSDSDIKEIDKNDDIALTLNLSTTPAWPVSDNYFIPGDKAGFDVNITNDVNTDAVKIAYLVYDPEYNIYYLNQTKDVGKNSTIEIPFEFSTLANYVQGGWFVLYKLYDKDGDEITNGYAGGFILSDDIHKPTPYYTKFTLTDPDGIIVSDNTVSSNITLNMTSVDFLYSNAAKLGLWKLSYVVYANNMSKSGVVDYGTTLFSVSLYRANPNRYTYSPGA